MSAHWEYLIALYNCGVRGIAPPEAPEHLDWEALAQLAEQQAVTPVVFTALRKTTGFPAQLRQSMHMTSLELSMQNRTRQEVSLDVLQKLRAAGIPAAVLKGMSLARYYAAPETRSCADTDVLIPPEREQDAAALLERLGFSIRSRREDQHHFTAFHPEAGLMEVHVRLWDDEAALAFGSWDYTLDDKAVLPDASLYGRSFPVLPPADAMLHLCLHLMKHFIQRQEGLRTAYDAALFFAENRDSIPSEDFWKNLRRWNADVFLNTILSVFVRAGCFREADFPGMVLQDAAACALLSADMEQYSREIPMHFYADSDAWLRFTRKQASAEGGSIEKSFKKRRRELQRLVLLPTADEMAARYPALKKRPFLYPFYWVHRGVTGVFSKKRRSALHRLHSAQKKTALVKPKTDSRIALMQQLGLFRE